MKLNIFLHVDGEILCNAVLQFGPESGGINIFLESQPDSGALFVIQYIISFVLGDAFSEIFPDIGKGRMALYEEFASVKVIAEFKANREFRTEAGSVFGKGGFRIVLH